MEYLIENYLISPTQSGFKADDLCTNQLVSITHEIYQSFDDELEVRDIILDIKLTYEFKQNEAAGDLLDTVTNFLKKRKQSNS